MDGIKLLLLLVVVVVEIVEPEIIFVRLGRLVFIVDFLNEGTDVVNADMTVLLSLE